jgi:hypothetical protein
MMLRIAKNNASFNLSSANKAIIDVNQNETFTIETEDYFNGNTNEHY